MSKIADFILGAKVDAQVNIRYTCAYMCTRLFAFYHNIDKIILMIYRHPNFLHQFAVVLIANKPANDQLNLL